MAKFTAYKISTKKAGMKQAGGVQVANEFSYFCFSGLAEQLAPQRQFLFLEACGASGVPRKETSNFCIPRDFTSNSAVRE